MILQIKTPRWALPLLCGKRYKGAKGGRASGKSHFVAEYVIENHVRFPGHRTVCIREVQKSLKFSAKQLLEDKIKALGVGHLFEIQSTEIHCPGGGIIIFQGMQDHTAESVKSLEGFDTAWCEEAQSLSKRSLGLLDPTMRKEGCEILFSWNPQFDDDPVEELFIDNEDAVLVHVNYTDNPFVPQSMIDLAERAKRRDIDQYNHIWLGEYANLSERQVFKNFRVGEIFPPENVVWFYGVDWGFSADPTAAIRCCIVDNVLYIDHEAYEVGVPMEGLPQLLNEVEDIHKWPSTADNARPETIDYCRRHGLPRMRRSKKGKGSVEDGITFIQSFDVVIHPRCVNTVLEFRKYSYKVHPKTEKILPVVEDANNHLIDALRYSVEGCHSKGKLTISAINATRKSNRYFNKSEGSTNWKTA